MNFLGRVARYWHTIRYLRPVQLYGRVLFRLQHPKVDLRPAPNRSTLISWKLPARRIPSLTNKGNFFLLNEAGSLDLVGWNGCQKEKLWRYNQHYFDDLNAIDSFSRSCWHLALIEDWVTHQHPGAGVGWEPYPLSLRIVNWIKWALNGGPLSQEALQSLAVQARWLNKRLEVHLLGNHLFSNAKALVFAGLFFDGQEADVWLSEGLGILAKEIPEQILADGGHFERSPMYHAMALEDILDLINVTNCFTERLDHSQKLQILDWPRLAHLMHAWLQNMCHPDGEISFFNDAAFDVAPSFFELNAYIHRLLPSLQMASVKDFDCMGDSGYIRLAFGPAVALLDVAPLGPDYLPGHAHADTLSFELSIDRQRVLVNSGTSCYGVNIERLRQRGTPAHNTVVIDDQDSSEVWGGFRVARRAYPIDLRMIKKTGFYAEVSCAHNGYHRLPGKPLHNRTWHMDKTGLIVIDQIFGAYRRAEARFHFHPDLQVQIQSDEKQGTILLPNGKKIIWQLEVGKAELESTSWHPRFGSSIYNKCLKIILFEGKSKLHLNWENLVV
jgi:uncharacterized heparinase superfamily protein